MRIVLTGSPCSGKTTLAKKLSQKLGYKLIHISDFVKEKKIFSGYDRKNKALIVNTDRLQKELNNEYRNAKNIIFEGHLLCEFLLKVDYVFVVRCHPDVLVSRMRRRGYSKKKIEDNVLAELLDYHFIQARMNYKKIKIFEINSTERAADKNVSLILSIIKGKRKRGDKVDWSAELLDRALSGLY